MFVPSDLLRLFQAASQLLLSLTSPPAWIQFCMWEKFVLSLNLSFSAWLTLFQTYIFKLPTIQKVYKKTGEDTQGIELLLTHSTSIVQELNAPLERTLKFFQDLEVSLQLFSFFLFFADIILGLRWNGGHTSDHRQHSRRAILLRLPPLQEEERRSLCFFEFGVVVFTLIAFQEATVCVACGKSPLSWRLLLNITVRDTAGQHRHVVVFEV